MKTQRVNGYDMAYIELGRGTPLLCVHGTLGDFRTWSSVLGPLSQRHRVLSISLRHFFPEPWNGVGDDFRIDQHVTDVITFIEQIALGPVDLMGHSRGGHIAFRVAQQRPDLLRRLVLAEPGGSLDGSLDSTASEPSTPATRMLMYADKVAKGDADFALQDFVDLVDSSGAWARLSEPAKQQLRDNAKTLIGQVHEGRKPYTKSDALSIRTPTLFVGGAETRGSLATNHRALARYVANSQTTMIEGAHHWMFDYAPRDYCSAVLAFLA